MLAAVHDMVMRRLVFECCEICRECQFYTALLDNRKRKKVVCGFSYFSYWELQLEFKFNSMKVY